MFGKTKKTASKIASLVLSVALFIPTMYGMTVKDFVRADDDVVKTTENTRLGVDQISNPAILLTGENPWLGSFVYFGKYNGQPIRFRVLDKASTKYTTDGSKTLFLDSDKVLYEEYFNNTLSSTDPNANKWSESDLKASLNGSGFLDKDGVFTQAEKDAIAESYVDGYSLSGINQEAFETFGSSVGLTGEKVFALDVTDILNRNYGYYDYRGLTSVDHSNYSKESAEGSGIEYTAWWLRNAGAQPSDSGMMYAGEAMYYSYSTWQVNDTKAVAPALNIDHDSILFSTAIKGTYGELGTEYKLTLLDPEMVVSVTEGSVRKDWNRISFETTHSGKNIRNMSRSSYLITSGIIGSANNSILDYGEVHGGNGSAYFVLPSNLSGTWGQDYHVYVFAEDLNGKYESDYASVPVELANPETSGSFSGKTLNNTKLGVDGIHDPAIPSSPSEPWNGSIVYFGQYEGNPIRFRVLDKDSTAFGDDTTLFLDSEGALFSHQFSDNGSNQWVGSDIRAALNGNAFLDKSGVFTNQEKDAIYYSNTQSHVLTGLGQDIAELIGNAVGLEDDQVFLLDVEDLFNESYGYKFDIADFDNVHSNAGKWAYFKDQMAVWALRNAEAGTNTTSAFVTRTGDLGTIGISYMSPRDIAPALNVDHDSILFSTAIKGTYGELGTAYKLTLLDPEMVVSVTEGSVRKDGNRISFETTHSGKNIRNMSRSSYLITSGIIGSANNSILDYGEVHGGNGSAYFVLPSSLSGTWGQDYHVYVFVEDLNGKYESDYAGPLVELVNPESSVPVVFEGKTASNTKLGVDDISDPRTPTSPDDAWNGSYVYFGKYSDTPVKYRVLDKDSTLFSDKTTVFLDCDSTLFDADFDSFVNANDPGSNVWINSDIRTALNGDAFLEKSGTFTAMEKSAIVASTVAGHPLTSVNADAVSEFVNYIGLENDKIFLLDAEDVLNPEYGYYDALANGPFGSSAPYHPAYNWYKCELQSPSDFHLWWLRSQDHELDSQHADYFAGVIFYGVGGTQVNEAQGVAPAMNIDSESILFSTAIRGAYGSLGTEYKLTLLDPEMIVSVPEGSVSMEGNQVNFGYGLSGQNFALRSQISYVVTSKPFGSDDNSILDYGATAGGNYKGYLTLSDSVSGTWGEDYHIYIFAEKFNGTYESDYAGPLVELVKPESSVPVVFEGKTVSNTKLGVDEIHDPATHNGEVEGWQGSIVYFGQYDGRPNRFRVLDKDSTAFGDDTTLFLDSELVLFRRSFSSNGSNAWVGSDIRDALNGDEFLDKDGVFTRQEKMAIYYSNTQTHSLTGVDQRVSDWFGNTVGLQNDQIFLLDIEDLLNEQYGYVSDNSFMHECRSNAAKWAAYDDGWTSWWLRNAEKDSNTLAAYVADNYVSTIGISNMYQEGVAPALNVDHDSILFSTAIKGTYGELGTEYKLTLLDPEMIVSVPEDSVSIEGNKVNFGYGLSGQNVALRSQISYIVTSKPFGSDDNSILDYGATAGGNYKGYLTLSDSVSGTWGEDYYIYIFAEKFNGTYESDYAGPLVELVKPESSVPVVFEGKTASNTKIGVDDISDPRTPTSPDDAWNGSYVYFGKYSDTPVKYRVLDRKTSEFSESGKYTMFLDSEYTITSSPFSLANPPTNVWADSQVRTWMNNEFLQSSFSSIERDAIAQSKKNGGENYANGSFAANFFGQTVGLNDYIFALDVGDVLNPEYGYSSDPGWAIDASTSVWTRSYVANRNKCKLDSGNIGGWWLRSGPADDVGAGYVSTRGDIGNLGTAYTDGGAGMAPALNVDHDSILFLSAIKGRYGELGTEYKLTLKDSELKMSVKAAEKDGYGTRTKVSYQLSGGSVTDDTKVSYLFTSKPIGEAGNSILAYGSLVDANGSSGYIPAMKGITGTWGQNYHVYVFAENVNGTYETDYAGTPVEISNRTDPAPVFSGKDTQNTRLGTGKMSSPAVPLTPKDAWDGSYVYFGKYEGEPVMYRVLDPDTDIFGSKTLFLDCDTGLYWDYFDEDNETNTWNDSDIRANLNGDLFLNKDGVFTYAEKASIAESVIDSHPLTGILQSAINLYGNYVGLDGDKVFVLDAEDTYNGQYGYINGYNDVGGWSNCWKTCDGGNPYVACWLRNAAGIRPQESPVIWCAGIIPQDPRMEVYADYAVSPALNVSQDSIIFSTAVEGYYGELGSAYKLTIKDPDIGLTVGDLEVNERSVSFTYTVSDAHKNDVTQISYLVVKKGTGYPKIDTIAAYGAVTLSGNHGGEFELPANLTGAFGTDYKVYVLAEDINGTYETDYAGMTELIIPTVVFDFTNGPVTCDQDQLDALAELFWNGDIDADEPIEDSTDLNRIDIDLDGTWDFELENNILTETSTCSIKTKKEFTSVAKYASVTFIVGNAPKIARHAIRLTGSIGVKFGVDFPDGTDVSKCYVQFETSTGRSSVVRTPVSENSRISYIFNITCLELADEITATLYYDGEAVQTDTFSAMSYITYVQDHPQQFEDRVVDLVNALQSYGYYMQRSDWSDNIRHTGIPKPSRILTSFDVDNATFDLNNTTLCGVQKNLGTSGISSGMKISLTLTSATELKLYVKPENSSVVMPSNAKAVDFNGVTYYEFSVKNIGPHLLDKMRSFEITTNLGTATVSLPATFYVKNMLNKSTTTEAQKVALTAYYQYYKAAKACVD